MKRTLLGVGLMALVALWATAATSVNAATSASAKSAACACAECACSDCACPVSTASATDLATKKVDKKKKQGDQAPNCDGGVCRLSSVGGVSAAAMDMACGNKTGCAKGDCQNCPNKGSCPNQGKRPGCGGCPKA